MEAEQNLKKKSRSLKRVVVATALFGSLIFILILTWLETILILFPTLSSYKRELNHEGEYVINLLGNKYLEEYIQEVKDTYYSTPEEIRADNLSDEYAERLITLLHEDFREKRELLERCRKTTEMKDIYICFFDEENERLVVVLDGAEEDKAYFPGQWISNKSGRIDLSFQIKQTMKSGWYMPVKYRSLTGWDATHYMGIYDKGGNLIGYITMNVAAKDLVAQVRRFLAGYAPVAVALIVLVLFVSSKFVKKRFLMPIYALEGAAKKVSSAGNKGEYENAGFFKELDISTGDEFEDLWKTMVKMEDDIASAMTKIKQQAEEKQKLETELDVAKSIQSSAIPNKFPAFPERSEFEIFASMTPAKEVGGDFYDFFLIDDDHLGMVIADVSDKGIPAALFMMMSKSILRGRAMEGGRPSDILSYVNRALSKDNANMMFVTMWFAILDTRTGKVLAANAGHEYPFVTGEDGDYHIFMDPHGIMCGVFDEVEFEDYEFRIPKGGKIFVYTDGIPEAHNVKDEMLGIGRLEGLLNKYKDLDPTETVQKIHEEVDVFADEAGQFDDLTMLCLKYMG